MNDKLELLKKLIVENNFIEINELFIDELSELQKNLSSESYRRKDEPNKQSFLKTIEDYEIHISELLDMIILLIQYGDKKYNTLINETVDRIMNFPKLDSLEKGYIWRSLSNYPLLLLLYTIGIMSLKNKNYDLLKILTDKKIVVHYGYNSLELKLSLVEVVNPYHLFNEADGFQILLYRYLQLNENENIINPFLKANERIYEYIKPKLARYLSIGDELIEYYDLFEYIIGLIYLYIKNEKNGSMEFSLFGLRYWRYSGLGRYYNQTDTIVHKFLESVLNQENKEFLESGIFGKDIDKFKNILNIYQDFLVKIRS